MRSKYRIRAHNPLGDVWLLQQRFLWIFWRTIDVSISKQRLENWIDEQNYE